MSVFGPGSSRASEVNLSGPYANLPVAGIPGRIYQPEDSVFEVLRDNGGSWEHFADGKLMTLPISGDFSWVNQGSATVAVAGAVYLESSKGVATLDYHLRVQAAPSTPWTIEIATYPNHLDDDAARSGLLCRESSTGKFHAICYGPGTVGVTAFSCQRLDSPTGPMTFGDGGFPDSGIHVCEGVFRLAWFRILDEGGAGDLVFSASLDGLNFAEILRIGRTSYLASGPNQVGFFINDSSLLFDADMALLHWKET